MATGGFLKDVSDTYSRRARLYPGFIVTLPVSVLAVVLVATKPTWWSTVVLLLSASGVSYFGAQLVRSMGRSKEPALWASWGGALTTQLLRFHRAPNRVAVRRRHDQLTRLFPDLPMPDQAAESADPQTADEYYEAANRALIERTRDKTRFDRVFDENCQYGFRRNLWGCRGVALWLAGLGLAATAALGGLAATHVLDVSSIGLAFAGGVDILLLLAFIFVVRPEWVREAADAYAQRLLGSLEILLAPGS